MEERERKRGADANLITAEIKEKVEDIYNQLDRMRDTVSCEKGANVLGQSCSQQHKN